MSKRMPQAEVDVILLHSPGQNDTFVELYYSGEEARQRIVDIIKNHVGVWADYHPTGFDEQDYDDAESGEEAAFRLIDAFNDRNDGYRLEWQERVIHSAVLE